MESEPRTSVMTRMRPALHAGLKVLAHERRLSLNQLSVDLFQAAVRQNKEAWLEMNRAATARAREEDKHEPKE